MLKNITGKSNQNEENKEKDNTIPDLNEIAEENNKITEYQL